MRDNGPRRSALTQPPIPQPLAIASDVIAMAAMLLLMGRQLGRSLRLAKPAEG